MNNLDSIMIMPYTYLLRLLPLLVLICTTFANVEKVIFVAPEAQALPSDASIDNLLLQSLTSRRPAIRTFLNASFPTDEAKKGSETWLLLEDLDPGQRYEVRVCWLATQPTSFWLYEHSLDPVFGDSELLSSLTAYSNARRASLSKHDLQIAQSASAQRGPSSSAATTFLFLQIFAAADYFTLNKTMMDHVPPVHVDLILDPFILNVLPKSLIRTGIYLIVIAVVGWFLSGYINTSLLQPIINPESKSPTRKQH